MPAVATFHLLRWQNTLGMVQALVFDRVRYRRTTGLQFLRVLGTGKGSSTAPGTEFGRTALFCLFDDEHSADAHIAQVARRQGLAESWHVKLRGAGGHGSWHGVQIPRIMHDAAVPPAPGPMAFITRANIRARSWRAFSHDAAIIDRELHQSDGLLAVVGVGEAPILRLGTFSVWRDVAAMTTFAQRQPEHNRVVVRTRSERWYGEEMFARFTPYWSTGSWDGRNPLDAA